ncbi:unnamed protein product [Ostreobium quekettii]|uniref:G-patch domain-containing protein n=1 Tax=Ostreobium quekettii TaxID=121088 RepID=A0A8S1J5B8_9CHLO|nr:unnamed protein product [Ostreobium quekettii]|eukprot:evm.model.scf_624.5 EVM.evm.TU.scf_624.5   scf_624:30169-37475(-)
MSEAVGVAGEGGGGLEPALEHQIAEQRASLEEIEEALRRGHDEDLAQLQAQLRQCIKDSEAALLELKRGRLLADVKKLEGSTHTAQSSQGDGDEDDDQCSTSAGGSSEDCDSDQEIELDPFYVEEAMSMDRKAVLRAADEGAQTDTLHFAAWESHSRGVASKLMAKMGYVQGEGLGRERQGAVAAPISGRKICKKGLGADHADGKGPGRKKARGGKRERLKKKHQKYKDGVEQRRDEANQDELAGTPGLFSVISKATGDKSEAASVVKKAATSSSVLGEPVVTQNSSAIGGDRKSLVGHQDHVASCRKKVSGLMRAVERNGSAKVLKRAAESQLATAVKQLREAEGREAKLAADIKKKEDFNRWVRF